MKTKHFIAIGVLFCLGLILLFAMPKEGGTMGEFILGIVATKAGAVLCLALAIRMIKHLEHTGEITIEEE